MEGKPEDECKRAAVSATDTSRRTPRPTGDELVGPLASNDQEGDRVEHLQLCTSLFYEGGGETEILRADIDGLIEAGRINGGTMVYSDQRAFPFDTWTPWSECQQCFGFAEGAAAVSADNETSTSQTVNDNDEKTARRERIAREQKQAEEVAETVQEDVDAKHEDGHQRVVEVESFGVGPDGKQLASESSSPPSELKGLVRDIQLRWDGTLHFRTCIPDTLAKLKERRDAAVRRKQEEEAAALKQAERIKTREESRRLERLFSELDEDVSGELSPDEVTQLARQLGWAEPELVFSKMDVDGSGTVDVSEFRRWWLGNSEEAKAVRTQKKQDDVKLSAATTMLKELPAVAGGQGLQGLTAGQLAVLT